MEKVTIPRPEPGISPEGFFESWLPGTLEQMGDVIEKNAGDISFVLAVRVEGDGGGDWSVHISGTEVKVMSGLSENSDVTLVLSRPDFEDAVTGKLDNLLPGMGRLHPGTEGADPARIAEDIRSGTRVLKTFNGTLRFCADDPERPFNVLIKFGDKAGDDPDTAITIAQDVLREAGRGETNLVQAFMSGKVKVEGAMDLVMKMTPLVSG